MKICSTPNSDGSRNLFYQLAHLTFPCFIDFTSLCRRISLPFLFGPNMNDDSLRLPDEETPLLNTGPQHHRSPTPLPKLQIAIVLLLQVCEPLTSQSIYPYINKVSDCEVNRSGAFSLIRCYVSDSLLANSISQGVTSAKWDIMLG